MENRPDPLVILRAFDNGERLPEPLSNDPAFNLDAAYAIEAELVRLRRAEGRRTVGLKVGFANRALWRVLKLDTLVWTHVYDSTLHEAPDSRAELSIARRLAPRIEPEIVLRLGRPVPEGADAAAALAAVDGISLGFEIIDCPFLDWKFKPADFVAASGFHVALVTGPALRVTAADIPALIDALPRCIVKLSRDGQAVDEGQGKNSLQSPALCLAELAAAISRRSGTEALGAGDLVSTGSLTTAQPVSSGEVWRADVTGLDLPALTLRFTTG